MSENRQVARKLVYLANARLPTEKAHGLQIVRMCEAFVERELEVVLVHPRRFQPNPGMEENLFDYYKVRKGFTVKTLPNVDFMRLQGLVPPLLLRGLFHAHALAWGLFASWAARRQEAALYFTREPSLAWWLTKIGLPTVFEAHTVPERVSKALVRSIAKSPHLRLFVVLSRHLQECWCRVGIPAQRINVVHHGVDLKRLPYGIDKKRARVMLGLPQDIPLVVYTGQLFPDKGTDTLVKAAGYLAGVRVLLIGGRPKEVARTRALASSLQGQNVGIVGHVRPDRVQLFLRAADVLVLPMSGQYDNSAYHRLPLKLFEYMASKRPLVASDLPALQELLKHGENAWLVKADCPSALAEGIKTLLQDSALRQKISQKAWEEVKQFTYERRAAAVIELAEKKCKVACQN